MQGSMSSGLQAYSSPPPEVTVKDAADDVTNPCVGSFTVA
jgi:hypothetical protein